MTEPAEFLLRVNTDTLHPDYQRGDVVTVRQADTAEQGAVAVVIGPDRVAHLCRYQVTDERPVAGVVTGMYRRLP